MKQLLQTTAKILVLFAIIITTSCNKNKEVDAQSAEDNARGALIVADAFAFSNSGSSGKAIADTTCYSIVTGYHYMEITFDNCNYNGIHRNGTLKINLTNDWSDGAVMNIEFIDFTYDGNSVSGKISAGYRIDLNGIYFEILAKNMLLNFSDGKSLSWESNLNFALKINGFLPVFEIYGYSSGINREGQAFEMEAEAIIFDRACAWPVSGIYTMTIDNNITTINFDEDESGSCNNIINVSNKYNSINIDL